MDEWKGVPTSSRSRGPVPRMGTSSWAAQTVAGCFPERLGPCSGPAPEVSRQAPGAQRRLTLVCPGRKRSPLTGSDLRRLRGCSQGTPAGSPRTLCLQNQPSDLLYEHNRITRSRARAPASRFYPRRSEHGHVCGRSPADKGGRGGVTGCFVLGAALQPSAPRARRLLCALWLSWITG